MNTIDETRTMEWFDYEEYVTKQKDCIVEFGLFDDFEYAVEKLTMVEECPAKFRLPENHGAELIHLVCIRDDYYVVVAYKNHR
jgi:hypothetical protein